MRPGCCSTFGFFAVRRKRARLRTETYFTNVKFFFSCVCVIVKQGETTTARKRPKSMDGNGNLLPVCPVKAEETAAGTSAPVVTAAAPGAPEQPAAAAAAAVAVPPAPVIAHAGASVTPTPVTAPSEQAAEPVNGIMGASVGRETAQAPPVVQGQRVDTAPMEGVTPSPPAVAATVGTGAATTATTSGGGGGATPSLDRVLSPPESTPATARELPTHPAPAVANGGVAHVPGGSMAPSQAQAAAAAVPAPAMVTAPVAPPAAVGAAVADPSAPGGHVAETTGGDSRVDGVCVANGEAKATTAAAGGGCDKAAGEAEGAAAATATATTSAIDPMEVDEDLGAEAAGDEASGTAAADSLDVSRGLMCVCCVPAAVVCCCRSIGKQEACHLSWWLCLLPVHLKPKPPFVLRFLSESLIARVV